MKFISKWSAWTLQAIVLMYSHGELCQILSFLINPRCLSKIYCTLILMTVSPHPTTNWLQVWMQNVCILHIRTLGPVVMARQPTRWRFQHSSSWATETCPKEPGQALHGRAIHFMRTPLTVQTRAFHLHIIVFFRWADIYFDESFSIHHHKLLWRNFHHNECVSTWRKQ